MYDAPDLIYNNEHRKPVRYRKLNDKVKIPGIAFEKKSILCYLQSKRYTIFAFIVIQNSVNIY